MIPRFHGHGFKPFLARSVPRLCSPGRSGSVAGYSSPRYTRIDRRVSYDRSNRSNAQRRSPEVNTHDALRLIVVRHHHQLNVSVCPGLAPRASLINRLRSHGRFEVRASGPVRCATLRRRYPRMTYSFSAALDIARNLRSRPSQDALSRLARHSESIARSSTRRGCILSSGNPFSNSKSVTYVID